jgi:hypothetical protein
MKNPFNELMIKPEPVETPDEVRQKQLKRQAIYEEFSPMVNDVLEMFIEAHRKGEWQMDSDCSRAYCCHIAWFAGPPEKFTDPYDVHHLTRRRLEVKLDMDGLCNPTGFTVTNFDAIRKVIRVSLDREELIRGIKAVME